MIALAFLALVLKVIVPPGFMLADQTASGGFSVVVCTGHGPLRLDRPGDHKAPPAKSRADAPCAVSGNLVPTVPVVFTIGRRPHLFDAAMPAFARDQAPGRGLVAPPPPAIGPPAFPKTA
jgi:hypothetical protein